jgi:hypothetical protein
MKAFLCVRSQGGIAHVLVLAEAGTLVLKVEGDAVQVQKPVTGQGMHSVAAVKLSEQYFVAIGEAPPVKEQHQAG